MSDGPEWFAAKRFGYGAGLPIAWQGWALLIGFFGGVLGAGLLASRSVLAYFSIVAALTALLLFVCAKTTRGGWRWRWGDED